MEEFEKRKVENAVKSIPAKDWRGNKNYPDGYGGDKSNTACFQATTNSGVLLSLLHEDELDDGCSYNRYYVFADNIEVAEALNFSNSAGGKYTTGEAWLIDFYESVLNEFYIRKKNKEEKSKLELMQRL